MISKDTIDEIFETLRIEDVIGEFVNLKRRGVNFLGLCPFHNEKTPSFTVSPTKNIYKCFGCGKAGNAVNFLMEHEHFTYVEALKYLAKKYNIEIEETVQTPEQLQVIDEKESLFNVSQFAQKFFTDNLYNTQEGKAIGLSYFKERGFDELTIKKFQLGYCLKEWDNFTKKALKNGYKSEVLEKSGFTISKNNKHYDRFRERVMFPIHTMSGRVVGFGGRILSSDKTKPKYVNTPESEIYHKGNLLYGIYFAKNSIRNHDNCYLVEGYTDVISLHQSGIENVVASSGTSLTNDQIRVIKRFTPNITILYDGDAAGIKASFRGINMILEQGMNVKIVLFPEGEDPDSFSRKNNSDDVIEFIEKKSLDFIKFKTKLLLEDTKNDPIKKASLIKDIVNTISVIPEPITRSIYVKECAVLLDISEKVLFDEIVRVLKNDYYKKKKFNANAFVKPKGESQSLDKEKVYKTTDIYLYEREIIRILLNYGKEKILFKEKTKFGIKKISYQAADYIVRDLMDNKIEFQDKTCREIFNEYVSAKENEIIPEIDFFINNPDKNISNLSVDLLSEAYELSDNWIKKHKIFVDTELNKLKEAVMDALLHFKSQKLKIMINELEKKIKDADNDETMILLLQKYKFIKDKYNEINNGLGIVFI